MHYFRPGFICRPPLLVVWDQQRKSSNIDLTNGLLTATANASANGAVMCSKFRKTGKFYAELNGTVIGGGNSGMGLGGSAVDLSTVGNTVANAFIQFRSGNTYNNGSAVFSNGNMSAGGILRVAYDADNHRAWLAFSAGNWNANAANNPATNVGGQNTSAYDAADGLAVIFTIGASGDTCILNAGATSFTFSVPAGFSAWNSS